MLSRWQFNILFIVGVGGAVVMLIAALKGVKISEEPLAYGGVGAILAYVLSYKRPPKPPDDGEEAKKDGLE